MRLCAGGRSSVREGGVIRHWATDQQISLLLRDWRHWLADHEPALSARAGCGAMAGDQRHVYFIQAGENGPVKIGITSCLEQRLSDLQIANHEKLRCLLTISGGQSLEMTLHHVLRSWCIHGEWFRLCLPLVAFVGMASRHPDEWGSDSEELAA